MQELTIILQIIGALGGPTALIAVALIQARSKRLEKSYEEKMKQRDADQLITIKNEFASFEKKQNTRNDIMLDRIENTEKLIEEVRDIALDSQKKMHSHESEDVNKNLLISTIQRKANQIVNNSLHHNSYDIFKSALLKWSDEIKEYALFFYKNENRHKDKDTFSEELRGNIQKHINILNNFLDANFLEYKMLGDKRVRFSVFLEENKVHRRTYALTERLIDNNLDNENLRILFSKYINDFFKLFLSAMDAWHLLDNYSNKVA